MQTAVRLTKLSILLIDERNYRIKGLEKSIVYIRKLADVAVLNKLQIHNSANAVYFSEYKHSRYVSKLWLEERKKLVDHKGKVVEAPGFYHDGEPIGDIIHVYEPQLPLVPELSFLKYREIREEEYIFSRRDDCFRR